MKSTLLVFIGLFSCLTLMEGADSTEYDRVHARLQRVMEPRKADGTPTINKQLRRWEWFWKGRLMEDGSFPSSQHYVQELHRVQTAKRTEDAQAPKTWKELGPTAPDLPGLSSTWNGIGRVNVVEFSNQDASLMYIGSAAGGRAATSRPAMLMVRSKTTYLGRSRSPMVSSRPQTVEQHGR
ncbi:MAG: hypothetical protein NTX15_01690 [Candidatus Kapabacteria bacterium]|nr:hypothetical protein [Candidatus Kapabacteria bacterium]